MLRYARLDAGGRPILCTPSAAELSAGRNTAGWGTDGKIIYNSLAVATLAARDLRRLGEPKHWAYLCPRSRTGHAHLSTRRQRR